MPDLAQLDRLAGRRHGLTTTSELLAAGWTMAQIRSLERRGILIRIRKGVFRMLGAPQTQLQAYHAAALASGDDAVLSHLTAAAVWGFPHFPQPDAIDVLRQGLSQPRGPGIRGHTTIHLPGSHRTHLWGVPLTTAERTFFDMCAVVPPRILARSADELVRQKRMTDERLQRTLDEIPPSGRRAIRPALAYLRDRPLGFERGANDRELDVLRALRAAGIRPLPEQQVRVRAGHKVYFLDYGWPAVLEAFEYMGFDPHGNLVSRFHHDADRTRTLQRLGWRVWPITAVTTAQEVVDIARDIVATLPDPSLLSGVKSAM